MLIGIALGPIGARFLVPSEWGNVEDITHSVARLALGIQLFLCGVELPKRYLWEHRRSLLILLLPVMAFTWIICSIIIYLCFSDLPFGQAMIIGACITPTDPVLSNSIVKGKFADKYVPHKLRNLIIAEAGANDGFAFPYLFLALFLCKYAAGHAMAKWAVDTIVYEILLSIVYGAVIGVLAKEALQYAQRHDLVDRESFLVFALAVALFILGTAGMIGTDDLLAAFIAGNAFTWDDRYRMETEEESVHATIDLLVNLFVFVYFGTVIPWSEFNNSTLGTQIWRLLIAAITILLFKRLPALIAAFKFLHELELFPEALFMGYFGPVGIGALYYIGSADIYFGPTTGYNTLIRSAELLRPIVMFIILSSVLVHGVTIPVVQLGKHSIRSGMQLQRRLPFSFRSGNSRSSSRAGSNANSRRNSQINGLPVTPIRNGTEKDMESMEASVLENRKINIQA